ncbi:MAG TPA: GMC family oxidoreductase N-terminal domain-containing protein, partial [Thermoanaerobaculia bacterium]
MATSVPRFRRSSRVSAYCGDRRSAGRLRCRTVSAEHRRWNSVPCSVCFLDRARSRITIISDVVIDRFSIEGDRARTLFGYVPDGAREIHAKRFVLCAGVYGSAVVLLRSGVGPVDQLGRLKIPIRMELPGVGANLHDHPGVDFEYEPTRRALSATRADAAAGRFYEAQVVLRSAPDLHIVPYQSRNKQAWSFGILAYYMN